MSDNLAEQHWLSRKQGGSVVGVFRALVHRVELMGNTTVSVYTYCLIRKGLCVVLRCLSSIVIELDAAQEEARR